MEYTKWLWYLYPRVSVTKLIPITLFVIVTFHEKKVMAYKVPYKLVKYSDSHVPYILNNSTCNPVLKYQMAADQEGWFEIIIEFL